MPATSVIVADLVSRGFVTKTPDPADGRRRILALTTAGRDVMADVRAHAKAPALIDALSDEQRTSLYHLLRMMQENDA